MKSQIGRAGSRRTVIVAVATLLTLGLAGMTYAQPAARSATAPTVQVVVHPDFGEILVGPNGMTLYTFAKEAQGDLRCWDTCAENWLPLILEDRVGPLVAAESRGKLRGELTTRERKRARAEGRFDNAIQVTYNGQPLYYWSRDDVPGDVTGHGIGDLWFVARP